MSRVGRLARHLVVPSSARSFRTATGTRTRYLVLELGGSATTRNTQPNLDSDPHSGPRVILGVSEHALFCVYSAGSGPASAVSSLSPCERSFPLNARDRSWPASMSEYALPLQWRLRSIGPVPGGQFDRLADRASPDRSRLSILFKQSRRNRSRIASNQATAESRRLPLRSGDNTSSVDLFAISLNALLLYICCCRAEAEAANVCSFKRDALGSIGSTNGRRSRT